ncbi:MAG: FixH family protein [Erythrobacter sp.]|nr:FixH family protein [Erythrobacter sp.]
MPAKRPAKPFTGRHMLAIFVIGFGIVAAVNFYMASLAVGGFHGIVVENSYVASQKFNSWLEEARKEQALGWEVGAARTGDGHVILETSVVPEGAILSAELRRPLGDREFMHLDFAPMPEAGRYRSTVEIAEGRWTVRLTIAHAGQVFRQESEL